MDEWHTIIEHVDGTQDWIDSESSEEEGGIEDDDDDDDDTESEVDTITIYNIFFYVLLCLLRELNYT